MRGTIEYRGFEIDYDPPPIPLRDGDWAWAHRDYDGPGDPRCGRAASANACKAEIDLLLAEEAESEANDTRARGGVGNGTPYVGHWRMGAT